jgi:hypothetical protein
MPNFSTFTFNPGQLSDTIELTVRQGPDSDDIDFEEETLVQIDGVSVWMRCGQTKEIEDIRYQLETSKVCVYWNDVPSSISIPGNQEVVQSYIMVADNLDDVALKEITDRKYGMIFLNDQCNNFF